MSAEPLSQFVEPELPQFAEKCLSVVMPVFNEERTVERVVHRVLEQPRVAEIVIVNDCSRDSTAGILDKLAASDSRIRVFHHEINRGKGAAVRTGFENCLSQIVIVQDADLEYDPREFDIMIEPILDGDADVVFGSRFLGNGPHRVLYFWHSVGNAVLTLLSNMMTNLNLSDMETCYKAFRREFLQQITLEEDRFGIEPEITAKVSRLNARIYEVSISYHGRTYAEGKKINWRDGFSALRCIFRYGLLRR
jgi:glycosyltransferase involved in cell wall biosynthesis